MVEVPWSGTGGFEQKKKDPKREDISVETVRRCTSV